MKSKISIITMFFLAFLTLSSFAPSGTSVSAPVVANAITEATAEAPKADKKARMMQKLVNTKMGRWALAKMQKRVEKRHTKLSAKLAIAEKAGDVKKVADIKKQMKKQINFKKTGLWLLLGGIVAIIVGSILVAAAVTSTVNSNGVSTSSSGGFGFGAALLYLGYLAALVGIVFIIVGFVKD